MLVLILLQSVASDSRIVDMISTDSQYLECLANPVRWRRDGLAGLVIDVLNGNPRSASTGRMLRLVQAIQQLFSLGKARWTEGGTAFHLNASEKRAFLEAARQVNKELARYRTAFSFETGLRRGGDDLLGGFLRRSVGRKVTTQEVVAVERVLDIANDGRIDFLERCAACGTWLFKRFSHQRFCSERCRMSEYQRSDKWKAYKRDKAHEYYWLHKLGKVKEQNNRSRSKKRG